MNLGLRMAFESQYLGLQRGYDLGFQGFTLPASALVKGAGQHTMLGKENIIMS